MDAAGLLWHLSNFFVVPVGLGVIAAAMTKLLWRRALASVPVTGLMSWAVLASVGAAVGGLVILGQDGRMATYAAMVLATAAVLWWRLRR